MSAPRLFLIDAHALCYRSFFAIKNLTTSYGQPTNAVFGFINTLRKILRDHQPEYMAVCFDVGKKTRRQEKYAEYKIHRPSMPDDLVSQIPLIKEVVKAYNLPLFELEGFEADDVIATISSRFSEKDLEIVIVSGDKDMLQLVNDRVKIFSVKKDGILNYNEARELFGIAPERITDFLSLAGDASDNIPGVKGIGEVTARELINEFGTLENIFKRADRIKSDKVREKLTSQKDQAVFSKELATLDCNVPIQFDLKALKVTEPDNGRLLELFKKLEFRKLSEEITGSSSQQITACLEKANTKEAVKKVCAEIQKKKIFAYQLDLQEEEEGFLFGGMAVNTGTDKVYYVSTANTADMRAILEDGGITKITHDVKKSMKEFSRQGIALKGRVFDVMLAGYLLSPSQAGFDADSLSWAHLKSSVPSEGGIEARTKGIFDLYRVLEKELREKSLFKLFEEVEIPLSYVLFKMEEEGVNIDGDLLARLSKESQKKIEGLADEIFKSAGMEFNLNSPKQLSHVLFEKLKLPVIKKTKTGLSTDEGVLYRLAQSHPLPALILDYRQLAKLKSTYIDALPKLINPKTKRLHASFNQTGTETGRLSSNDPNLQNIPIRTELGREIRKAFIPRSEHYLIVSADYSQIELRILAHLSGDKNLIKAFKNGQDIHSFTASLIFDVKESEVTAQMRNSAKRVNFGIIYGISAFGLSKDLEIPQQEAQEFIDRYFDRYPSVKEFMDSEIAKAQKNGFVLTLLNRRRYLPDIKSPNMAIRQMAERQAINTPVQGSAADLIKLAMINIQQELEKRALKSKMIITVHDELVFDVFEKEKDDMIQLIRNRMENPLSLNVPIEVTMKAGKNWRDLDEI